MCPTAPHGGEVSPPRVVRIEQVQPDRHDGMRRMARLPTFIRRMEGKRGAVYEARLSHGPRSGRIQLRRRFTTVAAAKAWYAETMAELAAGTFVAPSELTVREACTAWLDAKCTRVKPTTAAAYRGNLAPVIETFGDRGVQELTKRDVETLITELRNGTGRHGVWKRTSINPMLARWKAVWADLHAQGVVRRDVVALVEPLRKPAGEAPMQTDDCLTEAEVAQLLDAHTGSRREAFLHLALLGLRRAELAGLRWSAIDLGAEIPTLTVRETRIPAIGSIITQNSAKTISSVRTLPIPEHLVPILRRAKREQLELRARLGAKWEGGDDPYLFCGDLGAPLSPRTLNSWWERGLSAAGLPHRRLHASRHTAASLLHARGAQIAVVAAWLGHADGGVLALRTYTHIAGPLLTEAAALLEPRRAE